MTGDQLRKKIAEAVGASWVGTRGEHGGTRVTAYSGTGGALAGQVMRSWTDPEWKREKQALEAVWQLLTQAAVYPVVPEPVNIMRQRADRLCGYYYEALRTRSKHPDAIKSWDRLGGEWKVKNVDAMEHALTQLENEPGTRVPGAFEIEIAQEEPMEQDGQVKILDHGYMRFIESWGSDQRIVEAARMSTGKGFIGWGDEGKCTICDETDVTRKAGRCNNIPASTHDWQTYTGDEKLLRYLYSNHHDTPFEMAGMVIEVQAPIFVFREWHRHRTQSYNEASSRYEPLPDLNYVPTVERLLMGGGHLTKQAGTIAGAEVLTPEKAEHYQKDLLRCYLHAEELYQHAMKMGVPKELARVHLPVGRYSRMRASGNLRNLLAFLTLRSAPNAQWEIRQYAHEMAKLIQQNYPRTHALFVERNAR